MLRSLIKSAHLLGKFWWNTLKWTGRRQCGIVHGVAWCAMVWRSRWCRGARGQWRTRKRKFAGSSQGGRSERLLLVNLPHTLKKHTENHSKCELLTTFTRYYGCYLLDIHLCKHQKGVWRACSVQSVNTRLKLKCRIGRMRCSAVLSLLEGVDQHKLPLPRATTRCTVSQNRQKYHFSLHNSCKLSIYWILH